MAEFRPAPFRDLVTRLHREPLVQNALFGLHQQHWRMPAPDEPDTGVIFNGQRVGASCGPAAGPHTQLAQNILMSYVAGGRVIELKTGHDQGRGRTPEAACDYLTPSTWINWDLHISLSDALCEYAAGAMLIEMFRHVERLFGGANASLCGAAAFEIGLGYDLAGISRAGVRGFLDEMMHAGSAVTRLRNEIPHDFPEARELAYSSRVSDSVALSTCRDVTAEEIEKIAELLVGEHGLNLSVRLDAGLLGAERLDELMRGDLGYEDLRFAKPAREYGMKLDEAAGMCRRLHKYAARRGRHFRVKFGGGLAARCAGDGAPRYVTGRALHAATMTLAEEMCRDLDPGTPTGIVGGIDEENFAQAAACGFVPASACTDLMPARYENLGAHMQELLRSMRACDALDMNEYILKRYDSEKIARMWARNKLGGRATEAELERTAVAWAARLNTSITAKNVREDPRYKAKQVLRSTALVEMKQRVEAEAEAEVAAAKAAEEAAKAAEAAKACPNAAMFEIPSPVVSFDFQDESVSAQGAAKCEEARLFVLDCPTHLAYNAEYCDECGLCGEGEKRGGMLREAPQRFHRTVEAWLADAPRDGYVVHEQPEGGWIKARLGGRTYQLTFVRLSQQYVFDDGAAEAIMTAWHEVISARLLRPVEGEHRLDMRVYHLLRYLREGVVDERGVNPINVQWMACRRSASGAARGAPQH